MLNRLNLVLDQQEYSALLEISLKELRDPTSQARFIIRQELINKGLLLVGPHRDEVKTEVGMDNKGEGHATS